MPTLSELFVYPIKSCAGISLTRATLLESGLEYDRTWLIVEPSGSMITQRTHPRLALVKIAIGETELLIEAPGMPPLRTPLDARALGDAPRLSVTVWKDSMEALDTGEATARWFSAFLGLTVRLVRFAPEVRREVTRKWTGELSTHTQFADGFPVMVIGQASLDDLNARLGQRGVPAMPMNRFRPNLVISGLDAYEEDYVEHLDIEAASGPIRLRLVKLCTRCPVPDVDQALGGPNPQHPHEPLDTMSGYRANERFDGQLTFGKHGVLVVADSGAGPRVLEVGQPLEAEIGFDA
ncbi:MOSC domain-containing protein [Burkholderia gladioli]|uniref:MOSC domain-containing protein n=1 Tax=Burkholderia gladioli TaxID=28095 RepID=UPI001641768C|nr:MOSC N-terminal beta barrel domain-containing protein [Burkholderia gladioli]MBU9384282.1 MOSC N-terminal beta barrel domain-containing protein [Burkholderia gladioli]